MKFIINNGDEDALKLVKKIERRKNKSFILLSKRETRILFSDRIIQVPDNKDS
jgi:hypothetical protein